MAEFRQIVLEIGTRIYTGGQEQNQSLNGTGFESIDVTEKLTRPTRTQTTSSNTFTNRPTLSRTRTGTYSNLETKSTESDRDDDPYDGEEMSASDYEAVD